MSTAVALQELPEAREPPPELLSEAEWQTWIVECPPKRRRRSGALIAAKWGSIIGLLAVAGIWARVTPVEVVVRFIVDAGAIVVMARAILARRYAVAVVAAAVAVLFNPLAPVFYLFGAWQRAALVAIASPFLGFLIWRDVRSAHKDSHREDWDQTASDIAAPGESDFGEPGWSEAGS